MTVQNESINKVEDEKTEVTSKRTAMTAETPKVDKKVEEGDVEKVPPKRVKVVSESHWQAVFDLQSSRYYYWNKVELGRLVVSEGYESDDMDMSGGCGSEGCAIFRESVCSLSGLWRMGRGIGWTVWVLWFL